MINRQELERIVEKAILLDIDDMVQSITRELENKLEESIEAEKLREKKVQAAAATRMKSQQHEY